VAVRVLSTPAAQRAAMREGTRALLLESAPRGTKALLAGIPTRERLALGQNPYGSVESLLDDCRKTAVDESMTAHGGPVRSPEKFAVLTAAVGADTARRTSEILGLVRPILTAALELRSVLDPLQGDAADDVREQLSSLVFDGFVFEFGSTRLVDIPRYLNAATARLNSLPSSAGRDDAGMDVLDRVYEAYDRMLRSLPETKHHTSAVQDVFWMIEELRVGLFAQSIRTAYPVSEKRLMRAMEVAARS
jgi:ATP-dependent helicase HrpA